MVESLDRLMLIQFLELKKEEVIFQQLPQSSKDCYCISAHIHKHSRETETAVIQEHYVSAYIDEFMQFREGDQAGKLG